MNQEQVASLFGLTRALERNLKINEPLQYHCSEFLCRLQIAVRENQFAFLVIAVGLWDAVLDDDNPRHVTTNPIYEFLHRVDNCPLLVKGDIWSSPVPILE